MLLLNPSLLMQLIPSNLDMLGLEIIPFSIAPRTKATNCGFGIFLYHFIFLRQPVNCGKQFHGIRSFEALYQLRNPIKSLFGFRMVIEYLLGFLFGTGDKVEIGITAACSIAAQIVTLQMLQYKI